MASTDDAVNTMIRNLEEKMGKPLEAWMKLVKESGKQKHGEIVEWLKGEHGLTHGYANLVAHRARESDAGSADPGDLVEAQYSGKKNDLRPIYDALIEKVRAFGPDVEIAPKKTYVSLRRKRQFGLVQPSTATRVDVGMNLKRHDATARLESSGSFNAMVSHRVRVESVDEVDEELEGWLREAYDDAG